MAWDPKTGSLRIETLRQLYHSGAVSPKEVLDAVYQRIDADENKGVWISFAPRESVYKRLADLTAQYNSSPEAKHKLPLFGIPYAVKDNVDVAGIPTTAACPEYAYTPKEHATVVGIIEKLGALMIGKTNLDQFAAGLVGTRTPYAIPHNAFNKEYISGGSSSGSGVAVSVGQVSFALGTDTAGSGRVPGALNNVVGLKPTKGVLSAKGVVAAARMLDCVAVFALTTEDARLIFELTAGTDEDDRSRENFPELNTILRRYKSTEKFTFGVPKKDQLLFFGNQEFERLYYEAIKRLESLGGTRAEFDYGPFNEAAKSLYQNAPLSERLAALEDFFNEKPDAGLQLTKAIIEKGYKYSAVDAYKSTWRLAAIRHQIAHDVWSHIDCLLLPTVGTTYKIEEVIQKPMSLNSNLGYYTNFVNLLDTTGLAVPNGFTKDGLPMGVTFIGPAFSDEYLLDLGGKFHRSQDIQFGRTGHKYSAQEVAHKNKPKAHDEVLKVTRFHPDTAGETHITSVPKVVATSNWNGHLSAPEKATSILFRKTDADWKVDWHHPPKKQYIIQLEGSVEMTASDGNSKVIGPGEVVLVEDVDGKAHKTRAVNGPTKSVFVAIE